MNIMNKGMVICEQRDACLHGTSELIPINREDGHRTCNHETAHVHNMDGGCGNCANRDYERPYFKHPTAQCTPIKKGI